MPKTAEEIREYHREYARKRRENEAYKKYQQNYHKKRYEENIEEVKQKSKAYYNTHANAVKERMRAYRLKQKC